MAFFCQIYKDWKLELFRSYSAGTSHKFQPSYDFLYPEFLLIYVWSYAQFDLLTGSAVIKSMYWENLYQSRSKLTSLKTFSFNGHVLEINVYKSNKELFPHSYNYSHPSTRGAGRILESNTNPWLSLWFALLLHFLSTPFELRWGYVQKGFLLPHYSTSASKWITPVVHFEVNFRSKWSHTSFTSTWKKYILLIG